MRIDKTAIAVGQRYATISYPEVEILGPVTGRGMVLVRIVRAKPGSARAGWEIPIPWQALRAL